MKRKLTIISTRKHNDVIIVMIGYKKLFKGVEQEIVLFEITTNKQGVEAIKEYIK